MKKILLLISVLLSSFLLASCGGGSSSTSSTSTITILAAPSSLTATASEKKVFLTWIGNDEADSYRVHQATNSLNSLNDSLNDRNDLNQSQEKTFSDVVDSVASDYQDYDTTATSIEIPGLANGITYYFMVTALVNGEESPASNEVIGYPDFPIPSAPTSLTVTSASSGTVNLSWTGSDEAVSYRVHQATNSLNSLNDNLNQSQGEMFSDAVDSFASDYRDYDTTATSIEITDLMDGETYYFVVTALANGKESLASNEVIDFPIPPMPTSLTVTSASSGTVNLSWSGSPATTYKVHQSTQTFSGGVDYETLASYSSIHVTVDSIKIADLTNGTLYYFVVTALANGRESPPSDEVDALPDFPIPPAPTNLVATLNIDTVNLSWNGSDGTTYKVHQSTQTFSGVADYEILASYTSIHVTTTSTEITDLRIGTRYYFVVTALANGKESPVSKEVSGILFDSQLNDTGVTWGGSVNDQNGSKLSNSTGTDCNPTGFAAGSEQDCHQGRDAAAVAGTLTKIGGGKAGFDFTKLGSDGTELDRQRVAWRDDGRENRGTTWSCVRDNVTGAVWEVKTNKANSIYYRDARYGFGTTTPGWTALVESINQENDGRGLCGYNDWRAPTLPELHSLIDFSGDEPSMDSHYFPNVTTGRSTYYWSATPSLDSELESKAWRVDFIDGTNDDESVEERYHVRLIRSSYIAINSWPDSRYTEHGNGTVTDNATGLMWAKCSLGQSATDCTGEATTHRWNDASEQASSSTLANYSDWRLPNIQELGSIAAYDRMDPSINENIFPNLPVDEMSSSRWRRYISSTPQFDHGHVKLLNFKNGEFEYYYRYNSDYYVRLVRSIQ